MPRKAKEKIDKSSEKKVKLNIENIEENTNLEKSVSDKSSKTKANTKKETTKKATSSKSTSNATSIKKVANAKTTTKTKSSTKTTASKRKSKTSTKRSKSKIVSPAITTEYYDLPFRYNQTIVKVLAQTPNTLFIYWDISDEDRESYIQKYGANFFHHTKPYLIITNETLNYHFEVEINDFANSWYLHINDANCKYKVELIRKFIVSSTPESLTSYSDKTTSTQIHFEPYHLNDCVYITSSNEMESPNDHILFDKLGNTVFFKNTKNNIMEEKNISTLSFMHKIGKVYNIYDLYKEIYHNELISEDFGVNLPSSSSSPTYK